MGVSIFVMSARCASLICLIDPASMWVCDLALHKQELHLRQCHLIYCSLDRFVLDLLKAQDGDKCDTKAVSAEGIPHV